MMPGLTAFAKATAVGPRSTPDLDNRSGPTAT